MTRYVVNSSRTAITISEVRPGAPGKSYEEAKALAQTISGYSGKPLVDLTK